MKYRADEFGNIWTESKSGAAAGLVANGSSWYDLATNRMKDVGYDANGNQRQWIVNDSSTRAEYNAEGKMVRAGRGAMVNGSWQWDTSQVRVDYAYNGMGQRVKKTVSQGSVTGTVHYVYGMDGEVAAEWDSGAAGAGRQFLVGDQLGSTRVRLDGNGEVLQRLDYEPFGGEVARAGVSGYGGGNEVKQKFTGKERDGETGLDYFGARYMSAAQGRFTSPDKPFADQNVFDPQSWNLYSYTRNNPLKYVDRNGEAIETAWDALNIGLGVKSFVDNVRSGNYLSATVDAVGVVVDTAAAAVPFVPGGAGTVIKGARLANKADDVIDAAKGLGKVDSAVDTSRAAGNAADAGQAASSRYKPGGDFSPKTKRETAAKAGQKCEYCGTDTVPAKKSERGVKPPKNEGQIDHVMPKAKGGTNDPANARHACRECNREKSDKLPHED